MSTPLLHEHIDYLHERIATVHEEMILRGEWAQRLEDKEIKKLKESFETKSNALKETISFEADRAEEYIRYAENLNWRLSDMTKRALFLEQQVAHLSNKLSQQDETLTWKATAPLRSISSATKHFLRGLSVHRSSTIRSWVLRLPPGLRGGEMSPLLERVWALPKVEVPDVSIVIPVYGNLDITLRCLESLAQSSTASTFEVIVVDDASPDSTVGMLQRIENLVLIRNKTNLGFVGSCNAGAEQARGEMVLFLNNDTQVSDGFTDQLLEVFERKKDAGIVGAKLVYPDGRLQECGGFLWSDGDGWNYGRNGNCQHPEYEYLREVDFVSGACLMIPRVLFQRLKGFDAVYEPGYYEDTDLAFRVRQLGYRVYVQPRCRVVHFEGMSAGTEEEGPGMKRYQRINKATFVERWRTELARHPEHESTSAEIAMRHRCHYTVLFLDAAVITPNKDAGSYRTAQILSLLLEEGCHVTFASHNMSFVEEDTHALQDMGVRVLYYPTFYSVKTYLEKEGYVYDLIVVSRDRTAEEFLPWVRKYATQARVVYDTVDLHFLRESRQATLLGDEDMLLAAEKTRERELQNVRNSDITLVVSPFEQELLSREIPDAEVRVLPTIFDPDPTLTEFENREGIIFIGSFAHTPNIDAMEFFVGEVMPILQERLPGIHLTILGAEPTPEIFALEGPNVTVTGWVENVRPYFEQCRLSISPLRFGAGVKGKINMSLSWGVPMVGTPIACEGMFLQDRKNALIAEDAASFAEAVHELYMQESLWIHLREQGLSEMEARFSTRTARPIVKGLLEGLRS